MPADIAAELEAELGHVFAGLADIETQCQAIRAEAAEAAKRIQAEARQEAEAIIAAAHTNAESERAQAAAEATIRVSAENRSANAEAEQEAARIRHQAAERLPALIARVTAMLRTAGRPT